MAERDDKAVQAKVEEKMRLAAQVKELQAQIRLVNAEIARLGAPELAAGPGACW